MAFGRPLGSARTELEGLLVSVGTEFEGLHGSVGTEFEGSLCSVEEVKMGFGGMCL